MPHDSDEAIVLEHIEIRRAITEDGTEIVTFESADSQGDAMSITDALSLLEFAKMQLMAEMISSMIFDGENDE